MLQAFLANRRLQSDEVDRNRKRDERERRKRRDEMKRKKRLLECAFDGEDDVILEIIDQVIFYRNIYKTYEIPI